MTEAGRRELVEARLHSAARKLHEAGGTRDPILAGALDALSRMDFVTAQALLTTAYRQRTRGYWARASIADAVTDLQEAVEIARQPVTAPQPGAPAAPSID